MIKEFREYLNERRLSSLIRGNVLDPHGVVMEIGKGEVNLLKYCNLAILWRVDPSYTNLLLHEIRAKGIHRVKGGWETALETLMTEDIDTVFMQDLKEHPKEEVTDMLELVSAMVRNQIVVIASKSEGWSFKDFQKAGWQIWEVGGKVLAIYTVRNGVRI